MIKKRFNYKSLQLALENLPLASQRWKISHFPPWPHKRSNETKHKIKMVRNKRYIPLSLLFADTILISNPQVEANNKPVSCYTN